MILTVTLNASMDKKYIINDFNYDNTNRVTECENTAGGKGLNVSRVIRLLGGDVLATGIAGGNVGNFILSELDKQGVDNDFIKIDRESRACISVINKKDDSQTEFLEPGPTLSQEEVAEFMEKYELLLKKVKAVTISGSAPLGFSKDIYKILIEKANAMGIPCVLDASGDYLREGLKAAPFAVKPNNFELEQLFGVKIDGKDGLLYYAKKCLSYGVKVVLVSCGKDGMYMVTEKESIKIASPFVKLKNATGSGDSSVAGFAYALSKGEDLLTCVKYAVAAGASNASQESTGFVVRKDVEDFVKDIKTEIV